MQVLDRAFALLQVLANSPSELTLSQISQRATLHKSTAHRILAVLERHDVVCRNGHTGAYQLGLKLCELGSKAVAARPWRNAL